MIEVIAILAIGIAILLYAERQSNKKTIEEQSYKIGHLTDNLNGDDKRENQQLIDDYHFEKIVKELKSEDEYAQFEPDDVIEGKAKVKFKSLYGYEYRKDEIFIQTKGIGFTFLLDKIMKHNLISPAFLAFPILNRSRCIHFLIII